MTNKRSFKGFTLVELIVVMAVFGIIMLGAMQFLDPVSRMMKGASLQEANNASVDNVKRYFEGTLRCANAMDVHEGELPDGEENAVIDFVNTYYKNRADSNDDPIKIQVHLMKIDNDDHGKIKESVYKVKAGYTYKTTPDGGITWEFKEGNEIAPEIDASATIPYHEVINNVYYKDYSMFITLGYNEMSAANDVEVPAVLKKDHHFGRLSKVKDYYFGNSSRDSSSKSLFSFTFTTYKNGNAKDGSPFYREVSYNIENEDGSIEHKTENLFVSPYAAANASLALVNINSAFGDKYRSSLDYCPDWRKDGADPYIYKTTEYDEDEKQDVERTNYVENIEKRIGAYFQYIKHEKEDEYGNTVIDGNNIYIVYTIPEI